MSSISFRAFVSRHLPAILAATLLVSPATAGEVTGRASVIDGDTIEIRGERIRLWGIDAPESAQLCKRDGVNWRCGASAANALADHLGTRTTRCEDRGRDRYGRLIGRCYVGAEDISGWMVEQGHALAFRRYSLDYVSHEDRARTAKRGLWASEFDAPWDWRAKGRSGSR